MIRVERFWCQSVHLFPLFKSMFFFYTFVQLNLLKKQEHWSVIVSRTVFTGFPKRRDGHTDGQTLLQRCDAASKNKLGKSLGQDLGLMLYVGVIRSV